MPQITSRPSAFTSTTGFNGNWTNPANAYSSNDVYATCAPGRNQEFATNWRGFDFSGIPDGSTINSVVVGIERKVATAWSQGEFRTTLWADVTVSAALTAGATGAIGNQQYTVSTAAGPTTDTYWLPTITALPTTAQLKGANFGIRVQVAKGNNSTAITSSLDDIYITVDYTPPTTTVNGSFTASAVIKANITGSASADAVIKRNTTGSGTIDAVIVRPATTVNGSLTADAVIKRTQTGSATADAIIRRTASTGLTANAVIKATIASSLTASALVKRTATATFSGDAVLRATASVVLTADAVVRKTQTGSFSVDAQLVQRVTATLTADAVIKASPTGSFGIDAVIKRTWWFGPASSGF